MIEDMLTDLGCVVVGPASDLESAIALADQAAMDVGLLDINLDGVESGPVAAKLAARGVPFVFASGYARERAASISKTAPALQKPFNERDLARALAAALEGAKRA